MRIIDSVNNELVKKISKLDQKKYRDEEGLFLLEGEKSVKGAIETGLEVVDIIIDKKRDDLINVYEKFNPVVCEEKILAKISTTKTPPPILCSAKLLKNDINTINKNANLVIILENIKDAGNLGTIIRTATAFGADGIILSGDCVDIFSPKVIRSSAGNIFKIPFYISKSVQELKQYFCKSTFYATSVDENKQVQKLNKIKFDKHSVIAFGAESEGISDELLNCSDFCVKIPIESKVESLNLAISVGVILYEYRR